MIKFLCKDMWMLVFRKQIDNLKTNHRVCVSVPCGYWIFQGEGAGEMSQEGADVVGPGSLRSHG